MNVLRFVPHLFRMRCASLVAKRWRHCALLSVDRFPFGSYISDGQERSFALFPRLIALSLSARHNETFHEARLPTTLQRLQLEGDIHIQETDDDTAPPLLAQLTSLRACAPDVHSHRPFFEKYASRLLDLELAPDAWGTTWRWPMPSLTRLVVATTSDTDPDDLAALLALCSQLRSLELSNVCLERGWRDSRAPCQAVLTALTRLKISVGNECHLGDNLALHYLRPAIPSTCEIDIGCVIPPPDLTAHVTEIRLVKAKHLDGCSRLLRLSLHTQTKVKDVANLVPYMPLLATLESLTAVGALASIWPQFTQLRELTIDSFPDEFVAPRFPRLQRLTVSVGSASSPRVAAFRASLVSLISASLALESVTLVCCPNYDVASILSLLKAIAERGVPHLVCRIPRYIRDAPELRRGLREFSVTLAILPLCTVPC